MTKSMYAFLMLAFFYQNLYAQNFHQGLDKIKISCLAQDFAIGIATHLDESKIILDRGFFFTIHTDFKNLAAEVFNADYVALDAISQPCQEYYCVHSTAPKIDLSINIRQGHYLGTLSYFDSYGENHMIHHIPCFQGAAAIIDQRIH